MNPLATYTKCDTTAGYPAASWLQYFTVNKFKERCTDKDGADKAVPDTDEFYYFCQVTSCHGTAVTAVQ